MSLAVPRGPQLLSGLFRTETLLITFGIRVTAITAIAPAEA